MLRTTCTRPLQSGRGFAWAIVRRVPLRPDLVIASESCVRKVVALGTGRAARFPGRVRKKHALHRSCNDRHEDWCRGEGKKVVPEIRDIFQATCGPKVYESKRSCSQTIPHEFFSVFQRFREWRNKILAGKCDPLPSANSLKWADTTDEEEDESQDLFPDKSGVGAGVGAPNEIGVGAGVGPSLSPPPFNNRLGEDSIENSPELSWQLNLPVDSIEESSQETASQDLEAKKELVNAQERIAKQEKRPSEMRRETMLKRPTLTQQGVVNK